MKRQRQLGFTLTEMGILLLVIVATLGIAVPVLVIEQRRVQIELAKEQIRQLPDPILLWVKQADPVIVEPYVALAGPGKLPGSRQLRPENTGDLLSAMTVGNPVSVLSRTGIWDGPYVSALPVDPWGSAYVVLGLGARDKRFWILTAGPNGVLETTLDDISLAGDDGGTVHMR